MTISRIITTIQHILLQYAIMLKLKISEDWEENLKKD